MSYAKVDCSLLNPDAKRLTLNRTCIGKHKHLHKITTNQHLDCFITFVVNPVKLMSITLPNVTREQSFTKVNLGYS